MTSESISDINKKAFDAFAESYNAKPWQQGLAKQILESLQERKEWLGARWSEPGSHESVCLLDYACGTGAASLALRPFVTEMRGMDLADGMVKKYNQAMTQAGLSHDQAHAEVQDLTASETPKLSSGLFDVAIVSLALHHVANPALLIQRLSEQVKPGSGVVIVLDFLPFEHSHGKHKGPMASMAHTITKHGFSEADMNDLYTKADMRDFGFQTIAEPTIMGEPSDDEQAEHMTRQIFIARGTRTE